MYVHLSHSEGRKLYFFVYMKSNNLPKITVHGRDSFLWNRWGFERVFPLTHRFFRKERYLGHPGGSVKYPTLDFRSGCDLRVMKSSSTSGSTLDVEPA